MGGSSTDCLLRELSLNRSASQLASSTLFGATVRLLSRERLVPGISSTKGQASFQVLTHLNLIRIVYSVSLSDVAELVRIAVNRLAILERLSPDWIVYGCSAPPAVVIS